MKKHVILLSFLILFGCSEENTESQIEKKESIPLVTWVNPIETIQKKYYPALGLINTVGAGNINWSTSGTIEEILVKEGDEVAKGQKMASLECEMQILDRSNSILLLRQAELALDDADKNYERAKKISETGSISQEQLEKLEMAVSQAVLNYESAEIALNLRNMQVEDCDIVAPFDLNVEFVFSRLGNDVAIGMPALKILPLKGMRMEVMLAPHVAKEIQIGNTLVDENENIWRLSHKSGSSDMTTGAMNTLWEATEESNPENGIWVTTSIDMGDVQGYIVPLASIVQLQGPGVYLINDQDEIKWIPVDILVENDNDALVEGLTSSQRIVLRRPGNLRDGQKIRTGE
ncbi:hypothetical protein CL659_03450 [bacterium]|nr:hypothetical protein [bacterium]|tara:strand:+ start:38325 stop:39365 length:1041 start_codon:yes stop_codon:yes gene_type:complete